MTQKTVTATDERGENHLRTEYNRAVVLNTIRKRGPVSRTQIRELTGIRLASITELVRELEAGGMVCQAGTQEAGRGRKQVLLRLNPSRGHVIGVEFDADHLIAVGADLEARAVGQVRRDFRQTPDRQAILAAMVDSIEEIVCHVGGQENILGIGVADPGLIDSKQGVSIFSSTILDWRDVPLRRILHERFACPIALEENTRAKALYENRYGLGRDVQSLMFIDFGPGIGCGIVVGGELHRGASESAGEMGHMLVTENGPICNCGSRGCLEAVASMPAIASQTARAVREGANSLVLELAGGNADAIRAEHVFEAAERGDKLALSILDDAARYLGIAVANAVNLLNPEMVVFDARLARVADLMVEPVRRMLQRQALAVATRRLRVEVSAMGEEAGAMGAAALVLDGVFQIPQLKIPEYL